MDQEIGDKEFPMWLLGDSNPVKWCDRLSAPFDTRHPARHNVWTPIIDEIQDQVFREHRMRVETRSLYIRNAIEDARTKPARNMKDWGKNLDDGVASFGALLRQHKPVFLMTFGAFSYEFARRALGDSPCPHGHWGAKTLGEVLRKAIQSMDLDRVNVFSLLHATIARGKFIESHNSFCGFTEANYFEKVGRDVANLLLQHGEKPQLSKLWIPVRSGDNHPK